MKLATIGGKAHIVTASGGIDIASASNGAFSTDMRILLDKLEEVRAWFESNTLIADPALSEANLSRNLSLLDAPISDPSQVFAIGLNYQAHGEETGMAIPKEPMIFTKFQSSITGPGSVITLPASTVDWEVEMVVIVGKRGRNIAMSNALEHVAGYCVGQDLSERSLQMAAIPPQFSLAKSYENFAPIGPWITTSDEVEHEQLKIRCSIGEDMLQNGNTSQMIFNVPFLISYLSNICELRTGDLIFSGTPEGVGFSRKPPRFLTDGELLESSIEGLGHLANFCKKN